MSDVAIIIVNWNTGQLLADCIASIKALPEYDRVSLITVVDNNSTDDSLKRGEHIVDGDTKISFVRSGENVGFARATNIGIRRIPADNTSHVLLLNPDTVVLPGSIATLLDSLSSDTERIGIVGPYLQYPDGTHQVSVRRFPTPLVLLVVFLKIQHMWPTLSFWRRYMAVDFDYTTRQAVDQVMGACFLIRHDLVQQIGVLDERFWVWFEEVDYCRRAITAGWQVYYIPESTVTHYGGVSFHQLTGLKKSWPFIRSGLQYAKKHFSYFTVCVLYIITPITVLLSLVAVLRHRILRSRNQKNL